MIDDEPRRRSRKGAVAMAPGLLMRAVMYSPKDFAAGFIAFGAVCAIVGNAMFLQAGRHPSPLFGTPSFSSATAPVIANPLPRPRPLEAAPADKPLDSRMFDNKPAETRVKPEPRVEMRAEPKAEAKPEPKIEVRPADPMANLIRQASAARPAPHPPAAVAPVSNSAIQTSAIANPAIPRPPAAVPTVQRGDPLANMISCGNGQRCPR